MKDPVTSNGSATTDLAGLRIVVLSGGTSHEREVSLRSGRRVAEALERHGARVETVDPGPRLLPELRAEPPDLVWPVLHGSGGEDGALFGLLRAAGLPYIGPRPGAARLAWNKANAKTLVRRAGLSAPPGVVLPESLFRDLGAQQVIESFTESVGLPAVVKPVTGGSAQGVGRVGAPEHFGRALVTALGYADAVLVERAVFGREVMVGVADLGEGPIATPAVEAVPNDGVFDYEARYNAGETSYFVPARVSEAVAGRIRDTALTAFETIGLADLARIDMIVDEQGVPWFIEADAVPGLTETSIVPMGLAAMDVEPQTAYARLAARAIERGPRAFDPRP